MKSDPPLWSKAFKQTYSTVNSSVGLLFHIWVTLDYPFFITSLQQNGIFIKLYVSFLKGLVCTFISSECRQDPCSSSIDSHIIFLVGQQSVVCFCIPITSERTVGFGCQQTWGHLQWDFVGCIKRISLSYTTLSLKHKASRTSVNGFQTLWDSVF